MKINKQKPENRQEITEEIERMRAARIKGAVIATSGHDRKHIKRMLEYRHDKHMVETINETV